MTEEFTHDEIEQLLDNKQNEVYYEEKLAYLEKLRELTKHISDDGETFTPPALTTGDADIESVTVDGETLYESGSMWQENGFGLLETPPGTSNNSYERLADFAGAVSVDVPEGMSLYGRLVARINRSGGASSDDVAVRPTLIRSGEEVVELDELELVTSDTAPSDMDTGWVEMTSDFSTDFYATYSLEGRADGDSSLETAGRRRYMLGFQWQVNS